MVYLCFTYMSRYKNTDSLCIPIPQGITVYDNDTHYGIKTSTHQYSKFIKKNLSVNIAVTPQQLQFTFLKLNAPLKNTLRSVTYNAFHDIMNGYTVKLGTFFKHFPFRLEISATHISLLNYLGRKSAVSVKLPAEIIVEKLENAQYLVSGWSRIQVGNFINVLCTLKKKVNNKLDKRKFVDNLYVLDVNTVN